MKVFSAFASRSVTFLISIGALVLALGGGAYAASGHQTASANLTEHVLRLRNNWQSADPGNSTGAPRWAVSNGVVYLSGSLTQPSAGNTIFATLPKGARPSHIMYISIFVSQGAPSGVLQVFPNGVMAAYSGNPQSAQDFSSLAGISFPVGA